MERLEQLCICNVGLGGENVRQVYQAHLKGYGIRRLTASAGFSVANFEAFAISSFLRSGGIRLSSQLLPLLTMPVTEPWRAPVMPLTISAMVTAGC
jgi:hypothetical protein